MPLEPAVEPDSVIVGFDGELPDTSFVRLAHGHTVFAKAIPANIAVSASDTDAVA